MVAGVFNLLLRWQAPAAGLAVRPGATLSHSAGPRIIGRATVYGRRTGLRPVGGNHRYDDGGNGCQDTEPNRGPLSNVMDLLDSGQRCAAIVRIVHRRCEHTQGRLRRRQWSRVVSRSHTRELPGFRYHTHARLHTRTNPSNTTTFIL